MGAKGKEIIKLNVAELLEDLNSAYADEWFAYYQYWVGAQVVRGLRRNVVASELLEHAKEELEHAEKLSKRILQLGGTPLLSPDEWKKKSRCGYEAPSDFSEKPILSQNIKGERCAIATYQKLLDKIKDQDVVTFLLITEILEDEVEHEDDLQTLLEDLNFKY